MFALMRLTEGLIVAHLFLALTFLVGASAFPWMDKDEPPSSAADALLKIVCTCALGIGVSGVALFFVALAGLFHPAIIAIVPVVLIAAGSLWWKQSPLTAPYWRKRARVLWLATDARTVLIYYGMLLVGAPSILPNVSGDPIRYHLAYAQDFANAGRLVVDPFLRFPFYSSYFNLYFAALLAFGGSVVLNFLTWAMQLLTAFGIYAASSRTLPRTAGPWTAIISVALTVSVVFCSVFLRWGATAYLDVQIGAVALLMVLCVQIALYERKAGWLFAAGVICGYLIGMKASFFALAPIFLFLFFVAGRQLFFSRRALAALTLAIVAVASPWYVRNFALAGDPIAPILNNAIYGQDGLVTKSEWDSILLDLSSTKSVGSFVKLPVRAYFDTTSPDFREYGTTAIVLFLFLPGLWLLAAFSLGYRMDPTVWWPALVFNVFILYWFATSTQLRYGLMFYPLLAVCSAFVASALLRKAPRAAPLVALIAILAIFPSTSAFKYYHDWSLNTRALPSFSNDDVYLRLFGSGYAEEEFASTFYRRNHLNGNIYVFGGATEYFFRRHRIASMGDWIGPAGYYRLYHAVDTGQSAEFLSSLHVRAVLIDPKAMFGGMAVPLRRQLVAAGFCKVPIPDSTYEFLVGAPCLQTNAS